MTATLTTIRGVIERDLDRKIEEIVKVNQDDLETVLNEITEYVATEHINREYRALLGAIAEGPARPDERIGVWVSGFFGSGKSSFAKNLGYALRNTEVAGTPAGVRLAEQLDDPEITRLIDYITHTIPTTVLMFDVQEKGRVRTGIQTGNEPIAEIVYNVLLDELGYPTDWTLAELEIGLEAEGRLDEFRRLVAARYRTEILADADDAAVWRSIAKRTQALNRASAILHELDAATYPAADSWARSVVGREPRLDVGSIVERTFELMQRRRPGQALAIVIDEVGQYVGRSAEKIENLRAFVEQIGREGANRVKRRRFPAPIWVLITSQERLDEVVSALDEGRNLLPKLQDRFHHRVDLVPSDIREVATKRVLSKSVDGAAELRRRYAEHGGRLQSYTEFERSTRRTDLTDETFVQFYPFLPHFIDLAIDVATGLRARSSGFRQTGAANRTIIKQAHEMLIGEPRLAEAELGTLVTLDKLYDLVRHSPAFDQNHKLELDRIRQEFGVDAWEERVTKALALLEFVKNLPRTEKNIAAVLYDRLGADSPLPHVRAALANLARGQYVREAEDGWKLQTAEEKQWERERRQIDPRPKERNEAIREAIGRAFADAALKTFKLRGRTFKTGLTVQIGQTGIESKIGDDGQITLRARAAEPGESFDALKVAAQDATRDPKQQHALLWTFPLDQETDDLARDSLRSRAMVHQYDALAAQGKLQQDLKSLLQDEKSQQRRLDARLVDQVALALYGGTGFHAGNTYDGSDLGRDLGGAIVGFLGRTTPQIFPKLVAVPLKGAEADELLKAANLSNVPVVLHVDGDGLGLVVKREGHYVVNDQAPTADDVLRYLVGQKDYGVAVTGKTLTDRFQEPPYGWEQDTLRVVLAALMRAGKITVTHNGRQFKSHVDPAARVPFTNLPAFKGATFEPRGGSDLTLSELTGAADAYEQLTGSPLDVDAETIAAAFRQYAGQALVRANEVEAVRTANGLPEDTEVGAYRSSLASVATLDTIDAVRLLSGSGKTLKAGREAVRRIGDAVERHLPEIKGAQTAWRQMWPAVAERIDSPDDEQATAATDLAALLDDPDLYTNIHRVSRAGSRIAVSYQALYGQRHADRAGVVAEAIESLKSLPEWVALQPVDEADRAARDADRRAVLGELEKRACPDLALGPGAVVCATCGAGLGQIESDLAAVDGLRQAAIGRLRELASPAVVVRAIRVRDLALAVIEREDDIAPALAEIGRRIREALGPDTVVVLE